MYCRSCCRCCRCRCSCFLKAAASSSASNGFDELTVGKIWRVVENQGLLFCDIRAKRMGMASDGTRTHEKSRVPVCQTDTLHPGSRDKDKRFACLREVRPSDLCVFWHVNNKGVLAIPIHVDSSFSRSWYSKWEVRTHLNSFFSLVVFSQELRTHLISFCRYVYRKAVSLKIPPPQERD